MPRLPCLPILALLLVSGCASSQPVADGKQHAECTVCVHNADLACVDVTVTDGTPRCGYNGKEYYFCSEECREHFEKDPTKFAGK